MTLSLENFEDLIRHVEVHLQVSENFHREKRPDKKLKSPSTSGKKQVSKEDLRSANAIGEISRYIQIILSRYMQELAPR